MDQKLTEGALQTIMTGGEVVNPVMQILGSKKIAGNAANERYRLLVSDGVHLNSFAMLATQLNEKVTSGELADYSIVKINRHIVSMVNNQGRGEKRVMIILDLTVLKHGTEVGLKIGNPSPYSEGSTPAQSSSANPPQVQHSQNRPKPQSSQNNGYGANKPSTPFPKNDVTSSPLGSRTHPIMGLSPYQNKWLIKARVTSKSPIRTWSNAKGEGKLFSIDLVDESGEIRATAFKEQCDKFYDMIEVNKVYFISKCTLKPANKKFSAIKNDYEMTFNNETVVTPCMEEDDEIPQLSFNFTKLSSLSEMEPDTFVDVIGVCKTSSDVQNLVSRTTNRELKKREVEIVDQSLTSVSITLWGTQAEEFNSSIQPIVAVKNARVTEYNGSKSLSLVSSSVMQTNPDVPEAHKLRGWFDCLTDDANFHSISARTGGTDGGNYKCITLQEAKDSQLGGGDKPDYYSTIATLVHVRTENCLYKACPQPTCQKKVIDQNTGMYRCEKCNREYDSYKWRLLVSVQLSDWTAGQWVTLFQETAEQLFGVTADEIGTRKENDDRFNECFSNALFKDYVFRLRAKIEEYNGETRMKVTVYSAKPLDYKDYCRNLLTEIKEMTGISSLKNN
uniref:Replication protein A subunit n=1 Tax=Clastoptera arizonana TaxID=38151 RepID=A0A1B6CV81_9HEMI